MFELYTLEKAQACHASMLLAGIQLFRQFSGCQLKACWHDRPAPSPKVYTKITIIMKVLTSMKNYQISPSLLAANFAELGKEADAVIAAGADMLHLDVMDNHYVPNLTVGPLVCEALRRHGIKAPIDVHLMVKPVDDLIVEFARAGGK